MFIVNKPNQLPEGYTLKVLGTFPDIEIDFATPTSDVKKNLKVNFNQNKDVVMIYYSEKTDRMFLRPVKLKKDADGYPEDWQFFEEGNDVAKVEWKEVMTLGFIVNINKASVVVFRYKPTVYELDSPIREVKPRETVHDVIKNRLGTRWSIWRDGEVTSIFADQVPFYDMYAQQRDCRDYVLLMKPGQYKLALATENEEMPDTVMPWPEVEHYIDRPMIKIGGKFTLWSSSLGAPAPITFADADERVAIMDLEKGTYDLYWSDLDDESMLAFVPQRRVALWPSPLRLCVV